ncbi:toxin-antitoxin system HicB family antitoxin [Nocardia sp. IFM 10818]
MADKTFTLRLPGELHAELSAVAERDHISLNTAVIHAVRQFVENHGVAAAEDAGPGSPVKVVWRRDRTRFDDGEPDIPMPAHAVEIGRALGHISYVLANLIGNTKMRPTVSESCSEAAEYVTKVARYLDSDAPRPSLPRPQA